MPPARRRLAARCLKARDAARNARWEHQPGPNGPGLSGAGPKGAGAAAHGTAARNGWPDDTVAGQAARPGSPLTIPAQRDGTWQPAGDAGGQPGGDQESLAALFAPVRQPQPRGLGALYLTDQHRGTVETMLRAVQQGRPLVVLTGDSGIGKSTLLHGALDRLREPGTRVLRFVAPVSHATLRRALAQPPANGRLVLAIDGAELLSRRMLRYLFLKAQASRQAGQLFNVLLVGNSALASAIEQAIAFRPLATPGDGGPPLLLLSLAPFTPEEAARYLEHRVMATGYPARQLMTPSAKRIIANGSAGVPAHVDRLLDLSLKHASEQSQDWITAPVARAAWAEGTGRPERSKIGTVVRGAAVAGFVAVLAVVGYEALSPEASGGGDGGRSLTTDAWAGTTQHARDLAAPTGPGPSVVAAQPIPLRADVPPPVAVAGSGGPTPDGGWVSGGRSSAAARGLDLPGAPAGDTARMLASNDPAPSAATPAVPGQADGETPALPPDLQARYDEINAKIREIEQSLKDMDVADASSGTATPDAEREEPEAQVQRIVSQRRLRVSLPEAACHYPILLHLRIMLMPEMRVRRSCRPRWHRYRRRHWLLPLLRPACRRRLPWRQRPQPLPRPGPHQLQRPRHHRHRLCLPAGPR